MAKKRNRRRDLITPILFIALELFSILLIVKNNELQESNLLRHIRSVQSWVWNITSEADYYFNLRTENERLAKENTEIRRELEAYRNLVSEITTSENILAMDTTATSDAYSYIPARIIHSSTNNKKNYILLNKGSRDGVRKDMGVITPNGVLGIIYDVSENVSSVISILSNEISISVKLKKTGVFCPMHWKESSSRKAMLSEIPPHIRIVPADTVITSGLSSIFPPDIPIGTVISSRLGKRGFIEADVRMFEEYKSIRHVAIVVNNLDMEIKKLSEE